MAASWITQHIARLTGLDEETVASQITPSVQALNSRPAVQNHLEGLCGYSPEAKTFISTYLNARFGALRDIGSSTPSIPRTIKIGPSGPSLVRNAPLPSKSSKRRGASGATTPVSTSGRSSPNLSDAFGGKLAGGSVYIKGQMEEEELKWGGKSVASSSKSTGGSGTNTPDLPPKRQKNPGTLASDMGPSQRSGGSARPKPTVDPAENQQNEKAKSDAVRKLEKMMADLLADVGETQENASGGKQRALKNIEACYCQGRIHPLSAYTPSCTSCGLVVCSLHLPHLPCPSCDRSLLTSLARHRALSRLQMELDAVLRAEAEEREKVEQAKREMVLAESGGGAFPSLTGATTAASVTASSVNARKVLTLGGGAGSKSSNATMTTYTKRKVAEGVMPPKSATNGPRVVRVPRPRCEPLSEKEANAIWEQDESGRNMLGRRFARIEEPVGSVPEAIYVPAKQERATGEEDGGKKRKKKGKGVDGAVVPGAG